MSGRIGAATCDHQRLVAIRLLLAAGRSREALASAGYSATTATSRVLLDDIFEPNTAGSRDDARRLADFDQVAVGIPDIRADLASMVLRLGEELGALCRPFLVGLFDVSHANVEKGACAVGVGWRRQSDGGLVVRRTPAHIEYQPCVRDPHDHRVALEENLPVEQRLIELTGPVLIGDNKKMRDDEAVLRRRKVLGIHLTTSTVRW